MRFDELELFIITNVTQLGGRLERVADINTMSRNAPQQTPSAGIQIPTLMGPKLEQTNVRGSSDELTNHACLIEVAMAVWLRTDEDALGEYDDFVEHFYDVMNNAQVGPANRNTPLRLPLSQPVWLGKEHALVQFNMHTIDYYLARCNK